MIPTRVGQQVGGGYFAGVNRIKQSAYAIIVAPESTETPSIPFKTSKTATPNTQSVNDGRANTRSINNSSHPAAQYCCNLTAGSYTDWYLPSRDELELCYRYLKPGDGNNATGLITSTAGNLNKNHGLNPNSIPVSAAYTDDNPSQTIVTAFCIRGVAAFNEDWYRTSTEYSANTSSALIQGFTSGYQDWTSKTYTGGRLRAVRRVAI